MEQSENEFKLETGELRLLAWVARPRARHAPALSFADVSPAFRRCGAAAC